MPDLYKAQQYLSDGNAAAAKEILEAAVRSDPGDLHALGLLHDLERGDVQVVQISEAAPRAEDHDQEEPTVDLSLLEPSTLSFVGGVTIVIAASMGLWSVITLVRWLSTVESNIKVLNDILLVVGSFMVMAVLVVTFKGVVAILYSVFNGVMEIFESAFPD